MWLDKKACTKKGLESFLGHLCHAATVVHPGRTFLRALFSLLHHVNSLTTTFVSQQELRQISRGGGVCYSAGLAVPSSHQLSLLIMFTQMPQVVGVVVLLWRGFVGSRCHGLRRCWKWKELAPITIAAAL